MDPGRQEQEKTIDKISTMNELSKCCTRFQTRNIINNKWVPVPGTLRPRVPLRLAGLLVEAAIGGLRVAVKQLVHQGRVSLIFSMIRSISQAIVKTQPIVLKKINKLLPMNQATQCNQIML